MIDVIGVLLPVYKKDNPLYFKEALESLLNQTYKNFIIFIGIDGPIEGDLADLVNKYKFYENIQVNYFENNRGLACVLNDLIEAAKKNKCSFYARMDSDDICTTTRFEKQVQFLLKNKEIDVVGGAIEEIDEDSINKGKKVIYPLSDELCFDFFKYRDPLAHPAVMFSKTFFEKVSGYRSEYRKNQDTMLWYDGFMNGCKFSNVKETVLYFRITEDFYENRRSGLIRAKKMLKDRLMINKELKYDYKAYVFSFMSFFLTISPSFLKKAAYKLR